MSADDFQTKYASVMESMLKSAVAETTKLFETMVDELKAEILRLKEENEDLKTRCSRFEKTKSPAPVYSRVSEPPPGTGAGFEKRDTAIQCDLVPLRTMLVEQCQPLRDSSVQNQEQQWHYEETDYGLQEHNYVSHRGLSDSQMAYIQIKQEDNDDSCLQTILKLEEDEPTVICGHVLSANAGSTPTSTCGTKTGDISSPQEDEKTTVAMELPSMEIDCSLQGVQSQSSRPEHSLVISFAAIQDGFEKESESSLDISEMGTQTASDEYPLIVAQDESDVEPLKRGQSSVAPQHCQRESEVSVNDQTDTLQQNGSVCCVVEEPSVPTSQNKEVANQAPKTCMAEGESTFQPVHRKRGRPPKRVKQLKQAVKVLHLPSTTTEQDTTISSVSKEEVQVSSAVDTMNITTLESPKLSPVKFKKTSSIITRSVQERVNTALEENDFSSLPVSEVFLRKGCLSKQEKTPGFQQLCIELEEVEVQTLSNEVSSSNETLNTPQALALEDRRRRTSVTLQDAMLLVEAMNGSTEENASSSPQNRAVPPKTKCASLVGKLQTVDEIPAKGPMARLPFYEIEGKLPVTEMSTLQQSKLKTHNATPNTKNAALSNEAQGQLTGVIPNPQHVGTLSSVTTLPYPLPSAATQTRVGSLQQFNRHPLMSVAPSKLSNAAPQKIIVVPRSACSIMSPKIAALSPTQLPAVVSTVIARNANSLSTSTAASLPVKTPSLSSVLQKSLYLTSRKLPTVVPLQSSAILRDQQSKIILIPRPSQSKTFVLKAKQDSAASPQLSSSSQELKASLAAQTTSDEVATLLSQKRAHTSDNLESLKQTTTVPVTTNAITETSLKRAVEKVFPSVIPVKLPTVEHKLSAMVRLTRLPFPVSTKESVLVSRLISKGSSDTQPQLKGSTAEKIVSTQPSETPVSSTNICPNVKKTSISVSINAHQILEPNDVQKKEDSSYPQPSTSSSVPALVISTTEPSADENISKLDNEIVSSAVPNCALTNYPPVEKQSAASIQLTALTTKDTSDPHVQMTKTQFLAQLAVSPIVQASEKDSVNDFADDTACDKKTLQKTSLVARLRSHLKTQLQIRRAEEISELCMATETTSVSPKKPRLEMDSQNDNTSDPIAVSPTNAIVVNNVASPNKTTDELTPISPFRSELCKHYMRSKRSVSEPTTASPRRSKDASITASLGTGIDSTNEQSSSVSPRRPSSTKGGISPKKANSRSVSPGRTSSDENGTSPNNTKHTSVSPRRTGSAREGPSPLKTKCVSVSPRMSKSTSEPVFGSQRRSCLATLSPGTKQIKRESSSFSLRRFSVTTDGAKKAKRETARLTARWLGKDGFSPKRTVESTSAKKPRLSQDGKKNLRVANAKKLAKAAKAKTIAKMKMSKQKLQTGAKASQLAGNQDNSEPVKKCTSKAIWIPPKMPITKTPKKETKFPDHTAVYAPSLTIHPIPVKAPPVVSPLQPLLVIGGHLLKNQCGECGRILSSSAALESHVGLHTGRRPFSCTLCGKSFTDSKGLKRHGRVHRNGRIHVCPQCGKGFVYRFGLTKHLQMVHGRLKPFVCQICNKGFYTKRDVEAHIRIHTGEKPFHCNLCEKKFTRRVELNVHLRWHNGEKRHWCPYCGKGFLDFNNLKRHKYIHTGEKPHSCPHCPKRFTQSGHLKKHVKNVHKIE